MAHVAKYTAAASGHMTAHYERRQDENGGYIKFGNREIDTSKSHLNYNLGPGRELSQTEFLNRRKSEVRCLKRKDVNVMCCWVITLPRDPEKSAIPLDEEKLRLRDERYGIREKLFFERSYEFLEKKYGRDNVVSAYVHLDETTPHMHFAFVPVVHDKKKDISKISAKELLTKKELQTFHTDFENYLDSFGDFKFSVLNEATRNGNMTVAQMKAGRMAEEALNAENDLRKIKADINHLKGEKNALQGQTEALKREKSILSGHQVRDTRSGARRIPGAYVAKVKSFEDLCSTAALAESYKNKLNKALRDIAELKKDREELEKNLEKTRSSSELKLRAAQRELEEIKSGENEYKRVLERIAGTLPPEEVRGYMTENQFRLFSTVRKIHGQKEKRDSGLSL